MEAIRTKYRNRELILISRELYEIRLEKSYGISYGSIKFRDGSNELVEVIQEEVNLVNTVIEILEDIIEGRIRIFKKRRKMLYKFED